MHFLTSPSSAVKNFFHSLFNPLAPFPEAKVPSLLISLPLVKDLFNLFFFTFPSPRFLLISRSEGAFLLISLLLVKDLFNLFLLRFPFAPFSVDLPKRRCLSYSSGTLLSTDFLCQDAKIKHPKVFYTLFTHQIARYCPELPAPFVRWSSVPTLYIHSGPTPLHPFLSLQPQYGEFSSYPP